MDRLTGAEYRALIAAIDEFLGVEPTGEQGECPWCEAIRAPWAGGAAEEHRQWCPWARLAPLLRRLTAEG